MNKIAIIPARSGSKGLSNKNIIDVFGKPMISYTIEAAKSFGDFSDVIVSTDSEEYANISKKYGARVLIRGEELSNDTATSYEVIKDVLSRIESKIDYFVLLQPTSPLRTKKHIVEAILSFENHYNDYDFLVSVCKSSHPSVLIKPIDNDNTLKYFDIDYSKYKRQEYDEYLPNGAIFIGKTNEYLQNKHFFGTRSLAYYMSEADSIDVDTEFDLEIVRYLISNKEENNEK